MSVSRQLFPFWLMSSDVTVASYSLPNRCSGAAEERMSKIGELTTDKGIISPPLSHINMAENDVDFFGVGRAVFSDLVQVSDNRAPFPGNSVPDAIISSSPEDETIPFPMPDAIVSGSPSSRGPSEDVVASSSVEGDVSDDASSSDETIPFPMPDAIVVSAASRGASDDDTNDTGAAVADVTASSIVSAAIASSFCGDNSSVSSSVSSYEMEPDPIVSFFRKRGGFGVMIDVDSFNALCHQLASDLLTDTDVLGGVALEALKESAEALIEEILEVAVLLAEHAQRQEVTLEDFQLAEKLRVKIHGNYYGGR